MRVAFVFLFSIVLLAGCGADVPVEQPAVSAQDVPPVPEAPAAEPATAHEVLDRAIEAITVGERAWLRYDRERPDGEGGDERRVFIEVLGQDAAGAEQVMMAFMASQGYVAEGRREDGDGIRGMLNREGMESIRFLIRDRAAGPDLQMSNATSSIYLRTSVQ
ncbi:hypothetical protein GCM10011521_01120 [Arenimonas soli]|uniref:Lipoprotein n=1 Tax=Arenimonas soli TaxID=2269504 RepID=A0ABQ1H9F7_9GAMM|nr:hypothetical protein [Arenimonas soli]GGA66795.1 hypothetical protein GCM10011521_01120 [Arenimonas soli]